MEEFGTKIEVFPYGKLSTFKEISLNSLFKNSSELFLNDYDENDIKSVYLINDIPEFYLPKGEVFHDYEIPKEYDI